MFSKNKKKYIVLQNIGHSSTLLLMSNPNVIYAIWSLLIFVSFFWLIGFAFLFNWFVFYIQRQFLSMEGQCEIRDKAVKYICTNCT